MTAHVEPNKGFHVTLQTIATTMVAIIISFVFGASPGWLWAQIAGRQASTANPQPVPEWQTAAGGKMEFEVASVRASSRFVKMNFDWEDGSPYPPNGGYFSANATLLNYIGFAYKLNQTPEQDRMTLQRQPKWLDSQYFAVQARAAGNPTRDQMRLMMQSLLAERCKLAVHFEPREMQVLALAAVEPGKTGPELRPHSEGPPCDSQGTTSGEGSSARRAGVPLQPCGHFYVDKTPDHLQRLSARNVTIEAIATGLGVVEGLGRPVVDQTGLGGSFDFRIEWEPLAKGPPQSDAGDQPDLSMLPFEKALKDQLGLRLVKGRAFVQFLVIDHVEKPSQN